MNSKQMLLGAAIIGLLGGSTLAHAEGTATPGAKAAMGECHGINSCKGKSACKGDSNSCNGKNSCKGKGWVKMNEKACTKKHGTFKEMAEM